MSIKPHNENAPVKKAPAWGWSAVLSLLAAVVLLVAVLPNQDVAMFANPVWYVTMGLLGFSLVAILVWSCKTNK